MLGVNPVSIIAGLVAVIIGLADLWYFHALSKDSDLLFIIGGLASLGVHFVNGSASGILNAVDDLKSQVAINAESKKTP